ncbi:hypothetical protein T12_11419 [Trichinella patagoniensis]|uniref:Uncharacterized protein n=1 Tax=Trichinella patagoniensis TaxID=990121 RepID=A0A0V0ZJW3_9BILA|nr:hypothetical protein T12_11419 [Trichinella patagoniensis]
MLKNVLKKLSISNKSGIDNLIKQILTLCKCFTDNLFQKNSSSQTFSQNFKYEHIIMMIKREMIY